MLENNNLVRLHGLVLVLLFFNGNPLMNFLFGKFAGLVCLVLLLFLGNGLLKIDKNFIRLIRIAFLFLLIITVGQMFFLNYVSFLAMANFLLKIFLGGIVVYNCRDQLPKILFDLLAILSSISLLFYFNSVLSIVDFPTIKISENVSSLILYTELENQDLTRNSGMFWEPGAFAGIITLVLALNFGRIQHILKLEKFKITIITVTLLTTQSTTGYIVFFIILLFYFFKPKYLVVSVISMPIIVACFLYVFNTNDFLSQKFISQYEKARYQEIGDFSNTRFGSLIFDWHYIQKHPFIGNGFDIRTRYEDHQFLFDSSDIDVIGSGNSFSNYFAILGVIFIFGYFFLLWMSIVQNGRLFAFLILLVVLLNLQAEQWFNFPIYLGLPFLIITQAKN